MYSEEDYLMLSGIQHFAFCRRQWAMIHIEQQWAENYRTTAGELMHKKAHDEGSFEKRGDRLTVRGLRISSRELGLSGQCDVVEFHQDENGVELFGYEGKWNPIPIEYKHGAPKEHNADELQLCAQAICLEEMFQTGIPEGYLYYGESRRRSRVEFTAELREEVKKVTREMHDLFCRGYTPNVKPTKQCRACSLENIICFTYKGASPALMGACAERQIGMSFFSPRGLFLARVVGKEYGNVLLRKEQYRISDNDERSVVYAKNMIVGKVFNSRWSIERTLRDHAYRVDAQRLKQTSGTLYDMLPKIDGAVGLDELRGMEGKAAEQYFSVLNDMILNQKDDFEFITRNRRPPLDNINAILSFAYTVLAGDCANALSSVGLDPYVGFMHGDRPGRASLALDLMEELRPILADRFILTLINTKAIQASHFERQKDNAVLLNDDGRKVFFSAWQNRKKETITHPYLKEKIEWGLVPYAQALLLARTIRGDIDEYPPFLWK